MEPNEPRTVDRSFLLLTLLLVLGGLALATFRLGAQSLWLDEAWTWWFTRLGWRELLQAVRIVAVHPPLYYIYVKLLALAGTEAGLRLPSVLAYLAGIAGAIHLGFLVGGRPGGLAGGLVWAAHPLTLWMARDARPYALSASLAVLAVALFFRLQRSWSTLFGVSAGLVVGLGLLTHYFFFVLAAGLILLAAIDLRRSPIFFRRWTIVSLLAMIPVAVWLAWFFSAGSPSLGIGWIRRPVFSDIPLTLWDLASGYAGVIDFPSTLLGVALILLSGAGMVSSSRSRWARLGLAGIVLPLLAVWVVSQRRPVYIDRYFIVLLPFIVAQLAMGASALSRPVGGATRLGRVVVAVAFGVAAMSAAFTVHAAEKLAKEDWRGLTAFLRSRGASPAMLSLSEPEIALPLSYYFDIRLMSENPRLIPACGSSCWWIVRQAYTATHALTQSVHEAGHPEPPMIPEGCTRPEAWESPTGVEAWKVVCPAAEP
jgi:mannosyltransferase